MAVLFFINHLFSFFYNNKHERQKNNLKNLFVKLFGRVAPINLVLIAGIFMVSSKVGLIIFLVFKALIDIQFHINEHKIKNNIKI
jgi:hypothetical protein